MPSKKQGAESCFLTKGAKTGDSRAQKRQHAAAAGGGGGGGVGGVGGTTTTDTTMLPSAVLASPRCPSLPNRTLLAVSQQHSPNIMCSLLFNQTHPRLGRARCVTPASQNSPRNPRVASTSKSQHLRTTEPI